MDGKDKEKNQSAANKEKNKKQKKNGKKNMLGMSSMMFLILMVVVTVIGMIVFEMQLGKSKALLENQKYEEYDRYYAMITSDDKSDFWQDVYKGAKESGEENGTYVELFAGDVGARYSMEERMEIAIASDVDGIIVEGVNRVSMKKMIQLAAEKGIPVVTVSQDVQDSIRISFVGISNYELGKAYGQQVCELAKKVLNENEDRDQLQILVLMSDLEDNSGQNLLLSGIRKEVSDDEGISDRVTVSTKSIDDSGAFSAEEDIRDLFIGNTPPPDVMVCLSEIHTTCAYQAVVDYNQVGRTNIIGYYDSPTILNAIDKDIIFSTISMDTRQMGAYCENALSEYFGTGYVSDYFAVDTYLVNQTNVKEYLGGEEDED